MAGDLCSTLTITAAIPWKMCVRPFAGLLVGGMWKISTETRKAQPARFFGEIVCRIGKVYTFAETILATMKTPKQVIEAAKGIGTKVVFEHNLKGYAVFSVTTPSDTDPPTPTGLPIVILFDGDNAKVVGGIDALDWL